MPRPSWLWPAVVVTVAYAAAFALLPRGGFWINDNGAKFIQMEGIVRGSYADFSVPWPGRAVDPELTYNPLHHPFGEVVGGRLLVPYSATFAVPSSFPYRLFGDPGLYLLPLAAGLLTLPAVWSLAGMLSGARVGRAVPLASLGTPLWFYSLTFWEHTPAACLAVWSVLLAARHVAGAGRRALLLSAFLSALAVYFRDDLYLLGGALAVIVLTGGSAAGRRDWSAAAAFAAAFVAALVPLWLFQWWALGNPLGLHVTAEAPLGAGVGHYLAERWPVLSNLLLDAHGSAWRSLLISGPAALLFLLHPRLGAWRFARAVPVLAALGAAGGSLALAGHLGTDRPIWWLREANGLFAVSPFLILAFIREGDDGARRTVRLAALLLALGWLVLAPELRTGGLHWGCRLLLPLYPLMATLAASTIGRWWESKPPWRRTGATLIGACLALALALQLWSLHLLFRRVAFSAALNDAVMRRPESAVIAVGWFLPQELAHVFYNKQIFLAADPREVESLIATLRRAGETQALQLQARPGAPPPGPGANAPQARPAAPGVQVFADGLNFISVEMRAIPL